MSRSLRSVFWPARFATRSSPLRAPIGAADGKVVSRPGDELRRAQHAKSGYRRFEGTVDTPLLFGLSVLMSFVAFGLVTKLYIWPRLCQLERNDALIPLVVPHMFRFIGLSFLVPGVVSPSLPSAYAAPAAYGDLVAAVLAVAASV